MATIQQSIDIKVPVHAAYSQLSRFEDYPCFMEEVEAVQQLDDTHLHWTTVMANRPVEWDAEITERETDRCIAWHNTGGPTNTGKVELQAVGPEMSRVTFTRRAEPEQVPGSMAGNHEDEMGRRLRQDLARMKDFIEARASGASQPEDPQEGRGSPRNSPVPMSSYAAGSEGSADYEPNDAAPSTAPQRAQPGAGNAEAAASRAKGATGGTDAAAGAQMAGGRGPQGDTGASRNTATVDTQSGGPSAGAGAAVAGRTGLGGADIGADASDARSVAREGVTGPARSTGTTAGTGSSTDPDAAKP